MREERFETKEKAAVEVYGRPLTVIVQLKNLSLTGACLEWESEQSASLQKGDLIKMTVVLSQIGRRHQVNGEVIWIEGQKSGVQFINSEEVVARMIEKASGF
jgi:hypothetical protein